MRIWLDLGHPADVLFFRPLINLMIEKGHDVKITTRDFAETLGLMNMLGIEYEIIGRHGGGNLLKKGMNLMNRSLAMMWWKYGQGSDVAASLNQYAQCVAAFMAGIPSVTTMDYEYQPANHLSFRLARRVIVPEFFPEDALRLYGASPRKVRRYPGLKEEVYLSCFEPDPAFLDNLKLDNGKIIVTVRPPATFALYHRFENPVFSELMDWLGDQSDVLIVFLPRTDHQRDLFLKKNYRNVFIPPQALDGPNLLFHSDLVVSAGGTMNREAAVLGTPVYTVFAGRIPAVDKHLIGTGRMKRILERRDFRKIELRKKDSKNFQPPRQSVLNIILDLIVDVPRVRR